MGKALYFKNRQEWRRWLENNHKNTPEVWLVYYKRHTGKPSIIHDEAVEEALCFGWIDSKVKSIDSERFMQKYTPRSGKSVWSKINKDAAERLIKDGKMTPAGLAKIEIAKRSGVWQAAYTSKQKLPLPRFLKKALMEDKKSWKNFNNFANTYQNMYIGWVTSAKTEETRNRRVQVVVENAKKNKKATFIRRNSRSTQDAVYLKKSGVLARMEI